MWHLFLVVREDVVNNQIRDPNFVRLPKNPKLGPGVQTQICAVRCLHGEDVKSMTRCIELCLALIREQQHRWLCLVKAITRRKFTAYTLKYVKHVQKNARNI